MKLAYIARLKEVEIADLFYNALHKTLTDLKTISVYKLQRIAAHMSQAQKEEKLAARMKRGSNVRASNLIGFAELQQINRIKHDVQAIREESEASSQESEDSVCNQMSVIDLSYLKMDTANKGKTMMPAKRPIATKRNHFGEPSSPRDSLDKLQKRIKKQQQKLKSILHATVRFIKCLKLQIEYLRLVKEDQWNPFYELVMTSLLHKKNDHLMLAQGFQFYLAGCVTRKQRQKQQ